MVDITYIVGGIAVFCAVLALVMLFSKDALTSALSLLGILLGTAAIYGLMGEHFVATVQLVVYAGAIMVLFVFSIMLLNIKKESARDFKVTDFRFIVGAIAAIALIGVGFMVLKDYVPTQRGPWNAESLLAVGGNTRALAHSLFTQHFVAFEAVSLALLVAVVGAVTLAKRKFH